MSNIIATHVRKKQNIFVIWDYELDTFVPFFRHATNNEKVAKKFCEKWPNCKYNKIILFDDLTQVFKR